MELKEITGRAIEIRAKYSAFEKEKYGREWTTAEIAQGFVGDVGDLLKLVLAKQGIRDIADVDRKLAHELSDCLWSILIIANQYGIDLENSFVKTMDELEQKITSQS